jgi:TPR repeat protein
LIPVVVVLIALMAVTSFFYKSRKDQLAKESGAATEPTAASEQIKLENTGGRPIVHNPVGGVQQVVAGKLGTTLTASSEQIKLENAAERQVVHNPVRGVQHLVTAKLGNAQTTNAAKEADPVELWKAVKRGSVSAEVALANLYLEGEAVPQNCEQAHMLLHAASMKGNKAADDLLKSSYTVRCE